MSRSTDPKLDAALEADADKLASLGQDPGPTLDDVYARPDAPDAADYDYPYDDEDDGGWEEQGFTEDDCGRWVNGRLSDQCRLAGTEDCDWECPIGYRGDR